MGRAGKPWQRSDRPGWFATIRGKQMFLAFEYPEAMREFHRLLAFEEPSKNPSKMSTQLLVDRYLSWAKPRLAVATWDRYRSLLQEWVDAYGRTRAVELRPYHVTRWLETHPTWGDSSRHLATAVVKLWAAWCLLEGYLDVDRLRGVKSPATARRAPAPEGDIDRLLAAVDNPEFRDFLTVLIDTGCRPGEIRSLEASRVSLERSVAEVRGKRGPRLIGLTKRTVAILARLCARWPDGPVLRAPSGEPWAETTLKRYFDVASDRADIARMVPYHVRHDLWRRWTLAGIDSVVIALQLGHRDLKMLLTTYAHPDAAQLAAAAEAGCSPAPAPAPGRAHRGKTPAKRKPRRG
jgi:integrase